MKRGVGDVWRWVLGAQPGSEWFKTCWLLLPTRWPTLETCEMRLYFDWFWSMLILNRIILCDPAASFCGAQWNGITLISMPRNPFDYFFCVGRCWERIDPCRNSSVAVQNVNHHHGMSSDAWYIVVQMVTQSSTMRLANGKANRFGWA